MDAIHARKEDLLILSRAIVGKTLHEVCSNDRIGLAVDRTDVSENGYNFDLAADRANG